MCWNVIRRNNTGLKGLSLAQKAQDVQLWNLLQTLTFILVIFAARGVEKASGECLPLEQVGPSLRLVGHRYHRLCGQQRETITVTPTQLSA
jgi:hypothetical protein